VTEDNRKQMLLAARRLSLVWAGLVLGVSFLATPAKFLAPSLSLASALDVGRQTSFVLNRFELALGLALAGFGWWSGEPRSRWRVAMILPGALVVLQAVWLLPLLDVRVQQIIDGGAPSPSHLHYIYISLDIAKLAVLLGLGLTTGPRSLSTNDETSRPETSVYPRLHHRRG
jgi:hypothetical protein